MLPAQSVKEKDVRQALDSLAHAPASRNKALGMLAAAGLPTGAIKRIKTAREPIDPLKPDELRRVVAACRPEWIGRFITIAAGSGLRSRELTGLTWASVDAEHSAIRVNATALPTGELQPCCKTERSARIVPMIAPVRAALEAQRGVTGARCFVFGNGNDRPANLAAIRKAWGAALAACGLPYRKLYITRHSFGSNALDAGMPIRDVAAVLGHSSIQQLVSTYSRWARTPAAMPAFEKYVAA